MMELKQCTKFIQIIYFSLRIFKMKFLILSLIVGLCGCKGIDRQVVGCWSMDKKHYFKAIKKVGGDKTNKVNGLYYRFEVNGKCTSFIDIVGNKDTDPTKETFLRRNFRFFTKGGKLFLVEESDYAKSGYQLAMPNEYVINDNLLFIDYRNFTGGQLVFNRISDNDLMRVVK